MGSWFFERNTWTDHNLGIPSRSREIVAETYAIVGCSDHFESDSAGSAFRLGHQTRLRIPFRFAAPDPECSWLPEWNRRTAR